MPFLPCAGLEDRDIEIDRRIESTENAMNEEISGRPNAMVAFANREVTPAVVEPPKVIAPIVPEPEAVMAWNHYYSGFFKTLWLLMLSLSALCIALTIKTIVSIFRRPI